jgi:hypothetical protein
MSMPGRIDQQRSVSMDLDAAELFKDDGTLYSVNGVFIEVKDDRPVGLIRLGGASEIAATAFAKAA